MKKKPSKIQLLTFLIVVIPAIYFFINYMQGAYASYPTLFLTQFSGKVAITFLLCSLACTPLNTIFSMNAFQQARKTFGLTSFYYAAAHVSAFTILDYRLNLDWLIPEFADKPFLILSLIAFILLILLALTSRKSFQRKFSKLWIKIHRLVYLIGLLILIHVYYAIKGDKSAAFFYLIIYSALMALRFSLLREKITIKNNKFLQKVNHWLIS